MSKYVHSLGYDPRYKMSHITMGVSDNLKRECRSAMLHDNMNFSSLMMYAQSMRSPNIVEFLEIYG